MKTLALTLLAGLPLLMGACAASSERASGTGSQIGNSAADSATQATSSEVNQKVTEETQGFFHRVLGNH